MKQHLSIIILICSTFFILSCSKINSKRKVSKQEASINLKSTINYDFTNFKTKPLRLIPTMKGFASDGEKIEVNNQYITKGGEPWMPTYGEFQYSRCPREFWDDALMKIKSAGFYGISTYVFWIHHEEKKGIWNWEGRRNLRAFLKLCKKHGLGVFMRVGPFVHGECAYGGIPAWLVRELGDVNASGNPGKSGKLETTDPEYLSYVDTLYKQLSIQMKGLYSKDGGPIFAIQIDNENNSNAKNKGVALLSAEKKLALKHGMDVPIYTSTAWGKAKFTQDETLPVYGIYADNFWINANIIDRGQAFSFKKLRNNTDMGTNEGANIKIIKENKDVSQNNPYLTCENGSGMNMSFHRRTNLGAKDNGALSLVKIGSGCNADGFYIFHGGSNPMGYKEYSNQNFKKGTTYNCVVSNDFQAPISEFGQIRDSYYEYFVQMNLQADFGKYLAPCSTIIPQNIDPEQAGDMYDSKLLQNAIRTDGHKGFIFVNNYIYNDTMYQFNNVQFNIKLKNEVLIIPSKPCIISKENYFIWPFNLSLNGVNLKYATAQPFAFLKKSKTYFFFENKNINAEFLLDNKNIEGISGNNIEIKKDNNKTLITAKAKYLSTFFTVTLNNNESYKFVLLSQENAKHSFKNNENLYVTKNLKTLLFNQDKIKVISTNQEGTIYKYPNNNNKQLFSTHKVKFKDYPVSFSYKKTQDGTDLVYPVSKDKRGQKIGEPEEKYYDKGTIYQLFFPNGIPDELYDVYLNVDYKAAALRYYVDNKFIYDNFYNGTKWVFSARHLMDKTESHYKKGSKQELKFIPILPNEEMFIDNVYIPSLQLKHNILEVNDITLEKVYAKTIVL